jgi:CubicO group peptidase (beta-lactamase class C family)
MKFAPALLFVLHVSAQDFTALEQTVKEELARTKVPGASMAIVRGDRVVYAKGFGMASVETSEPVRPEMLLRLGSTTKMLTATALVGLSLEGKIDLNTPIGKYVAGLPPTISTITANQLLSHTSGLHDEAPMLGSHDESALGDGIRKWTDGWLFTKPGRVYSYSNPGYWMAGYLVEVLSGKPYADAMNERVFAPCAMTRTTLRPMVAITYPMSQGHEERGGSVMIPRPAGDNASGWPAGSVFSSVQDLSRYVIAFMNDGMLEGKRVLDPRIFASMSAPHSKLPGEGGSYGYGLNISEVRGIHMVQHSGSRLGYGSAIRMAPEQRVAVIVLANRTGANLPASTDKALELVLPAMQPKSTIGRRALDITADDLRRHPGVYRNGESRVEIAARDGKLYVKRAAAETALGKLNASRFAAEGTGTEYVFVGGADGVSEYLFTGGRSLARQ